jgi:urocanate reductase
MLLKYIGPHADEVPVFSGPGATGDGILMALDAGAAVRSMNYLGYTIWPETASYNDDIIYLSLSPVGSAGIIVNQNGERFCDESLGSRKFGSLMAKQSLEIVGLIVIDELIYEQKVKSIVDTVKEFEGHVYKANTIGELATISGVNPYLVTTVTQFNKAVDEGVTSQLRVPKTSNINKIITPPFYGIPFTLGMISTYGGLLVNSRSEVLDRDMNPIQGLYAAGAVMQGSLSGGVDNRYASYVGHMATCLVFGMISAENAATTVVTSEKGSIPDRD